MGGEQSLVDARTHVGSQRSYLSVETLTRVNPLSSGRLPKATE